MTSGDDPSKPTHSSMEVDSGNPGEEVEIKMMKLVKLVKRWRCNYAQLTKICPARIVKMVKINMMKSSEDDEVDEEGEEIEVPLCSAQTRFVRPRAALNSNLEWR